jgi:tetratricopeptide (TPR) repeat protein
VYSGPTELTSGDFARAESELRRGYDQLQAIGDRGTLSPVAAFLAQAVYAQGRYDEADQLASVSRECASRDDRFPHVVWRGVRAKVLARRGEPEEATALAREALELAEETDSLNLQADAWLNLAEVLRLGTGDAESDDCIERAVRLYEAKGNVASAGSARALLAEIGGAA